MSLPRLNIVVAVDSNNGIGKGEDIPWHSAEDMKFFKELTTGLGKFAYKTSTSSVITNTVIMGRVTYESLPENFQPLPGRMNVVISTTMDQSVNPFMTVFPSVNDALITIGSRVKDGEKIFIIGGQSIYNEILTKYLYLVDNIYITKFKTNYDCDHFFDYDYVLSLKDQGYITLQEKMSETSSYSRFNYKVNVTHDEYQYLDLVRKVLTEGEIRKDRTSVGTKADFSERMEFDISETIPILTTKLVKFDLIIKELLFFISGKTDTQILEDQGCNIWKGNTSEKFIRDANGGEGLRYKAGPKKGELYVKGDMGPMYGFLWRHWGAEYKGCFEDYSGQGIDQLANLIENIKKDPTSRRHILSAWDVSCLDEGVLNPCHFMCQFYISEDKYIDCMINLRSSDMFLGLPFNIASYAILTYMIGHLTSYQPNRLIVITGDTHIYLNHLEQVKRQLMRTPYPFPSLEFRNRNNIHTIDDFKLENFMVKGYISHPEINAKMAI